MNLISNFKTAHFPHSGAEKPSIQHKHLLAPE